MTKRETNITNKNIKNNLTTLTPLRIIEITG